MQKSIKYIALGLVVVGVILAWIAMMFSGNDSKPQKIKETQSEIAKPAMQRAVVMRQAVEAGHFLTADDVEVREVPQLEMGAFSDASALVGRGVSKPLAEGAAVLAGSLLSGISGMLQSGERAVSIKVDESTAVGHKVQPGDWVDVLVVFRKDGQEVPDTQARRLLERKRVLAYGVQTNEPRPVQQPSNDKEGVSSKADPATESLRQAQQARTAVLAVQVDEVNALMLAERQGQVMLALRSPLEAVGATPSQTPDAAKAMEASMVHVTAPLQAAAAATAVDAQLVVTLAGLAEHAGNAAATKPASLTRPTANQVARIPAVSKPRTSESGSAVELIRGTRTETVRY